MWIYSQSTGKLWSPQLEIIATGYSGHDEGKNNPKFQAIRNIGPIPRGEYIMEKPVYSDSLKHTVLPLTPHKHNALTRTAFLAHGDSIANPGTASKGCVVLPRIIRDRIWKSGDRILLVIE